jgi:hypothetical protein
LRRKITEKISHMQILCEKYVYFVRTASLQGRLVVPRKNSGIRGLSLRTEGAFGNAVFEGHIRYLHSFRQSALPLRSAHFSYK